MGGGCKIGNGDSATVFCRSNPAEKGYKNERHHFLNDGSIVSVSVYQQRGGKLWGIANIDS